MRTDEEATIWVDVEDFFAYFEFNPRPSGIQRLAFEIKRALHGLKAGGVRFVRRGPQGGPLLREVGWDAVEAVFHRPPPVRVLPPPPPPVPERPKRILGVVERLPPELRAPLVRAGVLQLHVWRNLMVLVRGVPPEPPPREAMEVVDPLAGEIRAGDWLVVLGAPWAVAGFPAWLADVKARYGVRAALLLYDLVPARHPEWCAPVLVAEFDAWLDATLPQCERLMAISRHTATDVEAYARERGLALGGAVAPIPIGTGFGDGVVEAGPAPEGLPRPGSYVLFVSTLEARKNHALAVRVWRRLADEVRAGVRDAASVPDLVFAGRVGWLVSDLLQQLENTAWLRGRVRLIRDPSDAELRALYAGCRFTIFPSLFEGWGLPVTESLAAGKPCLSSDAAALPEAGGALGRWFDPESLDSAHRAVAALLDDPAGVDAWEAEVRLGFRPVPWADTARAVLAQLGRAA